jgi:hypothetical protein
MVFTPDTVHPLVESDRVDNSSLSKAIEVETFAGKVNVEWDPTAAVTPIGLLPFFIEFLKLGHRFNPWVEDCPLHYTSTNLADCQKMRCSVFNIKRVSNVNWHWWKGLRICGCMNTAHWSLISMMNW